MSETFAGFTPKAFTFLRGLARHNNREWFEERRPSYEGDLRAPFVALVDEMDARLAAFAPEMVGDRRRSVFRIHRDVRFAKDKSPYKTNGACWFFHRDVSRARQGDRPGDSASAVHGGAGFYFQLAPNDCWVGGGLWMPPSPALKRVREAIAEDHQSLARIVGAKAFRDAFGALSTEEGLLTRPPRGYDAEHPAGAWLRYKSFTAGHKLADDAVLGPTLPELLESHYRALTPLVRWLNGALGLAAATRR